MRLAANGGELVELFGEKELRTRLVTAFPDLRVEFVDADNVYFILSVLDRAVAAAVRDNDEERGQAILGFVASLLEEPKLHPDIANAIGVSFVDPMALRETELGRRLWAGTPERLRLTLGTAKSPGRTEKQ